MAADLHTAAEPAGGAPHPPVRPSVAFLRGVGSPPSRAALLLLLLASGAAALIYQVLWQRKLGLLFGNTAHAAAGTLAVFFLGLALGSWRWGERAARSAAPLRIYAGLEIGIAVTALLPLALLPVSRQLYGPLHAALGSAPVALAATRLLIAAALLLPTALLMGGTLPLLAQHLVRRPDALGRTGSALVAINTLGGAIGALAAGFALPHLLGISGALAAAAALNALCAALAMGLARRATPPPCAEPSRAAGPLSLSPTALRAVAVLSGGAVLGLEVLWTRMFALVLHNSVYSFALVLCIFLVGLAGGGGVAHLLCRRGAPTRPTLFLLLLACGPSVALTPHILQAVTGGLAAVGAEAGWRAYLLAVSGTVGLTLLAPTVLLGTVFPFLFSALDTGRAPGRALGRLAALNTTGAIGGALTCGFLLIEWVGLWGAIRSIALLYLAAAALLAPPALPAVLRAVPLALILLFATLLDPGRLPVTRRPRSEAVLAQWESAYGVTAVVQRGTRRRLTLDNHYTLGDTAALSYERLQADLPLVLHRAPRTVFFLGLGTGITAGAALAHPIEQLTAVELVPHVAQAAREYFAPWNGELFTDARATVLIGDGRSLLLADRTPRDVIIADLFVPWQAGAGALYTREHFATVRERLAPGGHFAQWLPLYQLSRTEFMIIARTMLEVFPQVTLWRGDFLPARPIVALVGTAAPAPLDPERVIANFTARQGGQTAPRATVLAYTALFYAGNLGANRDLFADAVINTDDRPLIELSAPVTQREQRGGAAQWFTGAHLGAFLDTVARRVPLAHDPYLAALDDETRGFAEGGRALFASRVAAAAGRPGDAERLLETFAALVPKAVAERFHPAPDGVPGHGDGLPEAPDGPP